MNETLTPNPAILKRWADRARIEKQCRYFVKVGEYYCITGILADLYREDHPDTRWTRRADECKSCALRTEAGAFLSGLNVSDPIWKWAGFRTMPWAHLAFQKHNAHNLVLWNDAELATLSELADAIEGVNGSYLCYSDGVRIN